MRPLPGKVLLNPLGENAPTKNKDMGYTFCLGGIWHSRQVSVNSIVRTPSVV